MRGAAEGVDGVESVTHMLVGQREGREKRAGGGRGVSCRFVYDLVHNHNNHSYFPLSFPHLVFPPKLHCADDRFVVEMQITVDENSTVGNRDEGWRRGRRWRKRKQTR